MKIIILKTKISRYIRVSIDDRVINNRCKFAEVVASCGSCKGDCTCDTSICHMN